MARPEREEWYYGRDSRAVTLARLRRWVEIAAQDLSTEKLDHVAYRCALYLNGEEFKRSDYGRKKFDGKWLKKWEAEVNGDGPQEQVQAIGRGPRNGRG